MGKIRTRLIGNEEIEEKQKKEQKLRSQEKKLEKKSAKKGKKVTKEQKDVIPVRRFEEASPLAGKTGIQDNGSPIPTSPKASLGRGKSGMTEGTQKEPKAQKEKKTKKKSDSSSSRSARLRRARGKKYQDAKKHTNPKKQYELAEAVDLLKKISYAKFDESVELHLNVLKDNMKGEVSLPHSTGKTLRVAIIDDKVLEKIEKGVLDFDILIAHPSFMPKIARFARILGPRGLMPNPKNGTLTPKPEETAKKFQAGALRWKTEPKAPLIHQMIGKKSHEPKAIVENATAFIVSVGTKNISSAYIKSTMSPALRLNLENIVQ